MQLRSFEGRLFAIPWAIFGVLSTAVFIGATSDLFSSDNDEEAIMGVTDIDEVGPREPRNLSLGVKF